MKVLVTGNLRYIGTVHVPLLQDSAYEEFSSKFNLRFKRA